MSDRSGTPFKKIQQASCDTNGDICAELEEILHQKRAPDPLRRVATDFAGRGLVSRQYRDITAANEVPHRHDSYHQPHASSSSRGQPSSSKMFPCDQCGYKAKTKKDLRKHTNDHEKECLFCEKVLSTKHNKKIHVETVHEGKKPFHCVHCEMKFRVKETLKRHERNVHEHVRDYPCPLCGARFFSKAELKDHNSASHDGEKPYKCQKCDHSFSHPSSVSRHVRASHDNENWKCVLCPKIYRWKSCAARHIARAHGAPQLGPLRVSISPTPRQRNSGGSSKDRS